MCSILAHNVYINYTMLMWSHKGYSN